MIAFASIYYLEYIIKSSIINDVSSNIFHYIYFNIYKANITEDFTTQLKENSKAIAKKIQIYLPIHNFICYK